MLFTGEVSKSSGGESSGGQSDSEDEVFDDGLDDNLIGDEDDRARLEKMTEKEREQELFNRIEKREVLKTRFDIEKKLRMAKRLEQKRKKDKDGDSSAPSTKSAPKEKDDKTQLIISSDRKKTLEENKAGRTEKFAALKAKRDSKKMAEEKKEEDKKEKSESEDEKKKKDQQKFNPSQVFSSDESESEHSSTKRGGVRSRSQSVSSASSGSDSAGER